MPDQALADAYRGRLSALGEMAALLEDKTRDALREIPHIDRISFRVKEPDSFLKKASSPKYAEPLTQLEDQVAGRVLTFFRDDITVVRTALTAWFGDVEHEAKEPTGPSEFGYESDHFIFVIPEHLKRDTWHDYEQMPATFEMQVRTLFMHAWAEPQHDLGYKPGIELDRDAKRQLAWVAASAWGADRTFNDLARGAASSAPNPQALITLVGDDD